MNVLFVVSAAKDTGIFTSAKALAEKLKEHNVFVDFDKHFALKYDIVHIHNPLPTTFSLSKMMYWNKPIVCTTNMTESELHGIVPSFLNGLAKSYLGLFYSGCDKIIATSPKIFKNLMAKKELVEKTVYLAHAIDLKNFRRNGKGGKFFKKKYEITKPIVLAVASIQKRKGIFDFAKAAKELPQYQFVWVGNISNIATLEDREKIEQIMNDAGSNIVFTGFMDEKKLLQAYSAADVFVFPTYAETFGLVAVEAAATGLPVIARNLPELENFSDFTIKFNNVSELKKKIKMVLENEKVWKKYSMLSLKHSKKFDLNENVEKLIEIYNALIENNKKDILPRIKLARAKLLEYYKISIPREQLLKLANFKISRNELIELQDKIRQKTRHVAHRIRQKLPKIST